MTIPFGSCLPLQVWDTIYHSKLRLALALVEQAIAGRIRGGGTWSPASGAGQIRLTAGLQGGVGLNYVVWNDKDSSRGWQRLLEQEIDGPFAIYRKDVE